MVNKFDAIVILIAILTFEDVSIYLYNVTYKR